MTKTIKLPEKASLSEAKALTGELLNIKLSQDGSPAADVMGYLADTVGKGLRSKLMLCAAQDDSGNIPGSAIEAAAAIELLHLATLLHDDVIDDSEIRRGKPSVQKQYGKKSAVISGDYLLCQCFLLIAKISVPFTDKFERIARTAAKICGGEMRQFRQSWNLSLTPMDYLRVCAGKTAALFSLSLYAGSILGGYCETEARAAGRIGNYIGMAFQLEDDCMDYYSDVDILKKPVKNDLAEGVVTLPFIFAMAKEPGLRDLVACGISSVADIRIVASEVIRLGGVEHTQEIARRYHEKAEKVLNSWPKSPRYESLLNELNEIRLRKF